MQIYEVFFKKQKEYSQKYEKKAISDASPLAESNLASRETASRSAIREATRRVATPLQCYGVRCCMAMQQLLCRHAAIASSRQSNQLCSITWAKSSGKATGLYSIVLLFISSYYYE